MVRHLSAEIRRCVARRGIAGEPFDHPRALAAWG